MVETQTLNGQSTAPDMGEQTKRQAKHGVAGVLSTLPGFGRPAAGTFNTYRQMRANPTIAIARIAAQVPIRGAEWTYEAGVGIGLPEIDNAVAFIRRVMDRHRPRLLRDMLTAYDYGFAPLEKVFALDSGRIVPDQLKLLNVDITKPLEDRKTGRWMGLLNRDVRLGHDKAIHWAYDAEPGNHYGRSRHENIRETAYKSWQGVARKKEQYITKVAGVIPLIEYEPGMAKDEDGADQDTFHIAEKILKNLGSGLGVAMPRVFSKWAEDLIRSGANLRDLRAWNIEFLESAGQHGSDFISMMRHDESLMLRGWLVPERTVTEGQYGTKAEAGQHADIAIKIAELDLGEIVEVLNEQLVDQLLVLNYGPQYKGAVKIVAAPLLDDERAFVRSMMQQILVNPANLDLLVSMIDLDAAIDSTGLPKAQEVVSALPTVPQLPDGEIAATLSRVYARVGYGRQSDGE